MPDLKTLMFGAAVVWIAVTLVADGDYTGFYNAGGWGPAIIANFPPALWFVVASFSVIRKRGTQRVGVDPCGVKWR